MAITELYSMRHKDKYPDCYKYNIASSKLRNQISQILMDSLGTASAYAGSTPSQRVYQYVFNILKKEYGEKSLFGHEFGSSNWLCIYIERADVSRLIDMLEIVCRLIEHYVKPNLYEFQHSDNVSQDPDEAINEINERMKRDGFGYEYLDGQIIRIDEQIIHEEVVKPALFILQNFEGSKAEFLSAHSHYLQGDYEECIVDCCKAFESIMKAICLEEGWISESESKSFTASKLIDKCVENELIPSYMQNEFSGFKNLLSSGVPTIRNKQGGHGSGSEVRNISQGLVSYMLHLTATNIVFLGNCYHEMKGHISGH